MGTNHGGAPQHAGFRHRMPYGAELLANDRTRFRLWAPDLDQVQIELDDARGLPIHGWPMQPLDDGWFEHVTRAPPGTRYRYRINDDLVVPDPASRLQHEGDVHGASMVTDPLAYVWRQPQWRGRPWHETVIYEAHVGALGGYGAVQAMLPRLQKLGITAIELMPIAQFPGARNWGYDGVLPYAPAAAYGTPDELKALIDSAHEHGLMVFLDVVYNHFGPDGNYLHAYASPFFHDSGDGAPATPWGAAIDVGVPPVGDFFVHNALYWIEEFRFDGLRFDAVHTLGNTAWLLSLAGRIRAAAGPDRHVHLILENEKNQAQLLGAPRFDAQWNDDFHNALHVLTTGETAGYYGAYADHAIGKLVRCLAEGFAWQGEPMRGQPRGEPSAQLSPLCFVNFLQNHDQVGNRALGERLGALIPPPVLEAAHALLLLMPTIPMLFMGEEWGSRTPFLFFTDHQNEQLRAAVREGRQKEFAEFTSFGDGEAVPDPNASDTFERSRPDLAEAEKPAGQARVALIETLLALRREYLTPHLPQARSLGAVALGSHAAVARWQFGAAGRLVIWCNLGDVAVAVDAAATPDARWLHGDAAAIAALGAGQLRRACTLVCLESPMDRAHEPAPKPPNKAA